MLMLFKPIVIAVNMSELFNLFSHLACIFQEEITTQPLSFDKLAKYIRRRISPRSDVPHLSVEDQQMLVGYLCLSNI